ncbi:MAG: hypothetical protein AAFV53_07900 [Myxococcota bacterium]
MIALFLLACSTPPVVAPAPAEIAPVPIAGRTFTTVGGQAIDVPGDRPVVVELIRSADW